MQKQCASTAAQHALYASRASQDLFRTHLGHHELESILLLLLLSLLLLFTCHKQELHCAGVIGRRIKLQALLDSVPKLVSNLGPSAEDAHHAAVGITTTDLVSKSAAIEVNASISQYCQKLHSMQCICNMSEQGEQGNHLFAADLQSNGGVSLILPVNL